MTYKIAHFSIDGDKFVIFRGAETGTFIEIMTAADYHKDIGPLTPQPSPTSQDNLRLLAKGLRRRGIQTDMLKDAEAEKFIIKNADADFAQIAKLCCDIAGNLTKAHTLAAAAISKDSLNPHKPIRKEEIKTLLLETMQKCGVVVHWNESAAAGAATGVDPTELFVDAMTQALTGPGISPSPAQTIRPQVQRR